MGRSEARPTGAVQEGTMQKGAVQAGLIQNGLIRKCAIRRGCFGRTSTMVHRFKRIQPNPPTLQRSSVPDLLDIPPSILPA